MIRLAKEDIIMMMFTGEGIIKQVLIKNDELHLATFRQELQHSAEIDEYQAQSNF